MVLKIEITATDANELANEVNLLAAVLGGGQRYEAAKPDLTITRTSVEKPAKPATKTVKKALEKIAEKTEENDEENFFTKVSKEIDKKEAAERPFTVFKSNGDKFSDFKDAQKAYDRLKQEITQCASTDDLNALTSYNVDVVGLLPEDLQDAFNDEVDQRYNDLTAPVEDAPAEKITAAEAEEALKDFVRKKGLPAARTIMEGLKAKKFPDLKQEQYPKLLQELNRELKKAA